VLHLPVASAGLYFVIGASGNLLADDGLIHGFIFHLLSNVPLPSLLIFASTYVKAYILRITPVSQACYF
jgi:hypothetical protein